MGTFSKSLASIGGFIAADFDTINYLRHTCRTYIFSASDTPAATAAALEALHILQEEPERIAHLWDVTNYALKRFREEGFEIGETESPIIPLYVRDAKKTFTVTKRLSSWCVYQSVIPRLVRLPIRLYVLRSWQAIASSRWTRCADSEKDLCRAGIIK
jgi:7-keto-8-aminopelargonate synthetase-like enzyme